MDRLAIVLAALATASPAAAQQPQRVFTNIVDGRPQREIVSVLRVVQPAARVPDSIATTPVLERNYKRPLGPSAYVPPASASLPRWGETRVSRPTPTPAPWFINGIYMGPSPSGHWTSTSIGRPIIDVNIVGRAGR